MRLKTFMDYSIDGIRFIIGRLEDSGKYFFGWTNRAYEATLDESYPSYPMTDSANTRERGIILTMDIDSAKNLVRERVAQEKRSSSDPKWDELLNLLNKVDAPSVPMSGYEFFLKMESIVSSCTDVEVMHKEADRLMCEVLTSLGYGDGVRIFYNMPKWYA